MGSLCPTDEGFLPHREKEGRAAGIRGTHTKSAAAAGRLTKANTPNRGSGAPACCKKLGQIGAEVGLQLVHPLYSHLNHL